MLDTALRPSPTVECPVGIGEEPDPYSDRARVGDLSRTVARVSTLGARKYPGSELLATSAGRGWSKIAAELRSHVAGATPVNLSQYAEICIAIAGNDDALVTRRGAGQTQVAVASTGAIWLSPIGVSENEITVSGAVPQALHLYLSSSLFEQLAEDFNLPRSPARSIRYLAGIQDELIRQIGHSILSELVNETPTGRMYVETAALSLAARLVQTYCDSGACDDQDSAPQPLDNKRIRRVLDYIVANLSDDISLESLAAVAGYSAFHFARKFALTMGVSPGRYVSQKRLEGAMAELVDGKAPLAEIALNARFSSQASFTRAFHRATGMTPKEYQRQRR